MSDVPSDEYSIANVGRPVASIFDLEGGLDTDDEDCGDRECSSYPTVDGYHEIDWTMDWWVGNYYGDISEFRGVVAVSADLHLMWYMAAFERGIVESIHHYEWYRLRYYIGAYRIVVGEMLRRGLKLVESSVKDALKVLSSLDG